MMQVGKVAITLSLSVSDMDDVAMQDQDTSDRVGEIDLDESPLLPPDIEVSRRSARCSL